jgi:hypothetical protein
MERQRTQMRLGLMALGLALQACPPPAPAPVVEQKVEGRRDDKGHCSYKGRTDREVQEARAPGAPSENVRRVYGIVGSGPDAERVLLCREVDTNFDGVKDVVRTYSPQGDTLSEEADTDYDGRIDTWMIYAEARLARAELDNNGDGRADETRYYAGGSLLRMERDTNFDAKPDRFEVYRDGRLDRIGVDANFDGQVDRWDRDIVLLKEKARQQGQKDSPGAEDAGASGGTE